MYQELPQMTRHEADCDVAHEAMPVCHGCATHESRVEDPDAHCVATCENCANVFFDCCEDMGELHDDNGYENKEWRCSSCAEWLACCTWEEDLPYVLNDLPAEVAVCAVFAKFEKLADCYGYIGNHEVWDDSITPSYHAWKAWAYICDVEASAA